MPEFKTRRNLCIAAIIAASLPYALQSFMLPQSSTRVGKNNVHGRSNSGMQPLSSRRKDLLDQEKTEFAPKAGKSGSRSASSTSSTLNMIVDERREFEMNVGKAVDTLRSDYPKIFQDQMDFSIYHEALEVIDPSGVKLHGVRNYRNFFRVLRAIVSVFYCPEESGLTFRLIYDWARNSIRISWRAVLIPKAIYGGVRNTLHVDGISVYEVDNEGKIIQHRVENLLLNDRPLLAPKGIFAAVTEEAQGIPVLGMEGGPVLKSMRMSPHLPTTVLSSSSNAEARDFDMEAFNTRNNYRKKFGLPPLSPEEFEEVEAQVKILAKETQQKRESLAQTAQQRRRKNIFSDIFSDSCETNFDCERPEVCCDFILKKVCCASGIGVINGSPGELRRAKVEVTADYPQPSQF